MGIRICKSRIGRRGGRGITIRTEADRKEFMEEMEPDVHFVLIYSFNKQGSCLWIPKLWLINDSTIQQMYRAYQSVRQCCGHREGWRRTLHQGLWLMGRQNSQTIVTSTWQMWARYVGREV